MKTVRCLSLLGDEAAHDAGSGSEYRKLGDRPTAVGRTCRSRRRHVAGRTSERASELMAAAILQVSFAIEAVLAR